MSNKKELNMDIELSTNSIARHKAAQRKLAKVLDLVDQVYQETNLIVDCKTIHEAITKLEEQIEISKGIIAKSKKKLALIAKLEALDAQETA